MSEIEKDYFGKYVSNIEKCENDIGVYLIRLYRILEYN
jgi:hypothetical protein